MPKLTKNPLTGLVPAVLTPFAADGSLNLDAVEKQAEALHRDGVSAAFVAGTTGEFTSLTVPERKALAARWVNVSHATSMRVVVHVGANCLADARELAADADRLGAAAVVTVAPGYFKPKTVAELTAWCTEVAAAAPNTPFYFYDIPTMTGVSLPMPDFLERAADRIPTLTGLKFTNSDLMAFQRLLHAHDGRFDVLWGYDEYLLAAIALGGEGAVGSSYNFAAPLYHRVIRGVKSGDLPAARAAQFRSVQLITLLIRYGFFAACKEALRLRGVDCGPVRLPNANLTPPQAAALRGELEAMGFAEMTRAG